MRSRKTKAGSSENAALPAPNACGEREGRSDNPISAKRGLLWIVAFAAILVVLLHDALLNGKGLVPADGILENPPWDGIARGNPGNALLADQSVCFIPQHIFVQQRVRQGDFPLWNPHIACGLPNLASIQGALLFPIQLITAPIDPFYAAGPAAFLKLFLAGSFMMLYVRTLGACLPAAFLSGLVFSLSGFMIAWLGHPHVNCAMWLPLLFYYVEKQFKLASAKEPRRFTVHALRNGVGLAIAYGCMLLGGHPPTAVHVTGGMAAYVLFRLAGHIEGRRLWIALLLAGSLAAGGLLAAPQLLPYLEYYPESSSAIASQNLERWDSHLMPGALAYFLLPYCSGAPNTGFEDLPQLTGRTENDNFSERTGYVGIAALFLAFWAIIGRRCKLTFFYMLLALFSLLIIFGIPPLPSVIRALPILNSINHTRLLLLAIFSVAVLAGLGLDSMGRTSVTGKIRLAAAGFGISVGFTLLLLAYKAGPQLYQLDEAHRSFLYRQLAVLAGGIGAVGLLAFVPCSNLWWRRLARTACLGWTAFELLWFGMGYNPAISRELYYPQTSAISWLKQDRSLFRILGAGPALPPNTAEVFNLNDVRGNDFVTVKRYEEFITGKAGDFFFYSEASSLPPGLQLLNIKYVMLPKSARIDPNFFELAYSSEVDIYRYKEYRERALAVFDYQVDRDPASVLAKVRSGTFDPADTLLLEEEPPPVEPGATSSESDAVVHIASYEPDEIVIEAAFPRPGFLLLLDTYFPGWSAEVNGRKTRIYRADYNFRAVSMPAGKSTLKFSYKPQSLQLGACLAIAGLFLLGAGWIGPDYRKLTKALRSPFQKEEPSCPRS